MRAKLVTVIRWYAQNKVNQEDSELNEVDGMKKQYRPIHRPFTADRSRGSRLTFAQINGARMRVSATSESTRTECWVDKERGASLLESTEVDACRSSRYRSGSSEPLATVGWQLGTLGRNVIEQVSALAARHTLGTTIMQASPSPRRIVCRRLTVAVEVGHPRVESAPPIRQNVPHDVILLWFKC